MRTYLLTAIAASFISLTAQSQTSSAVTTVKRPLDSLIPIRGFCIDAPRANGVDSFVRFINEELAPRKVNTLLILVDYHYQFKSHPELADSGALSNADVKK